MNVWLQFLGCAAVILVAGSYLAKYGDAIADATGLGRTWIGLILLATVTSLPELITGISSVALFAVPNIAVGDILGSCLFNLLLLALVDALCRRWPSSTQAHSGHILAAAFGGLLLGVVALGILAGTHLPTLGWVGVTSLVTIPLYALAMRLVFQYELRHKAEVIPSVDNPEETPEESPEDGHEHPPRQTRKIFVWYALSALVIVAVASYLPHVGEELAAVTGLGTTFVGNLFIAASTSLPEIVVSIAAVRMGAIDLAYGNLLGSNLINVAILGVDDMFFRPGALLADISRSQLLIAVAAMTMSAIVIVGLVYRAEKKRLPLAWDALGLVVVYVVAILLLYTMSA